MPGVVAHEIEHIRFQGTFNDYNRENEALRQLSITDKEAYERITTRVNGVPVLNGSDEAVERFPVASRLEKYMSTDAKEMYKADGCSNYSTAYWEGWQKGDVTTHLAYHETLAEISRLHQEGGGAGFIDSRWSAMHSLVSVLHQEKYGW
jgi:hypothetical protein